MGQPVYAKDRATAVGRALSGVPRVRDRRGVQHHTDRAETRGASPGVEPERGERLCVAPFGTETLYRCDQRCHRLPPLWLTPGTRSIAALLDGVKVPTVPFACAPGSRGRRAIRSRHERRHRGLTVGIGPLAPALAAAWRPHHPADERGVQAQARGRLPIAPIAGPYSPQSTA